MFKAYIKKIIFLLIFILLGFLVFKLITPEIDTSAYDISNLINFKRDNPQQTKPEASAKISPKTEALAKTVLDIEGIEISKDFYETLSSETMSSLTIKTELNQYPKDEVKIFYFFNYACGVCNRIMPFLDQWQTQTEQKYTLVKKPVSMSRAWEKMARAYYTLDLLGKNKELDNKIMYAIHNRYLDLYKDEVLFNFMSTQKIDLQIFRRTFNSSRIKQQALEAELLSQAYESMVMPIFFVHGPGGNFSTHLALTKTPNALLATLDYLVAKASGN